MGISIGDLGNAWLDSKQAREDREWNRKFKTKGQEIQLASLDVQKANLVNAKQTKTDQRKAAIRTQVQDWYKASGPRKPFYLIDHLSPADIIFATEQKMAGLGYDKLNGAAIFQPGTGAAEFTKSEMEAVAKGELSIDTMPIHELPQFWRTHFPKDIKPIYKRGKIVDWDYSKAATTYSFRREAYEKKVDNKNLRETAKAYENKNVTNWRSAYSSKNRPLQDYFPMDHQSSVKAVANVVAGDETHAAKVLRLDPRVYSAVNMSRLENKYRSVLATKNPELISAWSKIFMEKKGEFNTLFSEEGIKLLLEDGRIVIQKPSVKEHYPALGQLFEHKDKPVDFGNTAVLANFLKTTTEKIEAAERLGHIQHRGKQAWLLGSDSPPIGNSGAASGGFNKLPENASKEVDTITVDKTQVDNLVTKHVPPEEHAYSPEVTVPKAVSSEGQKLSVPVKFDLTKPEQMNYARMDKLAKKERRYRGTAEGNRLLARAKPYYTALNTFENDLTQANYDNVYQVYRNLNPKMTDKQLKQAIETGFAVRFLEDYKPEPHHMHIGSGRYVSMSHNAPIVRRVNKALGANEMLALKSAKQIHMKGELIRGHIKDLEGAIDTLSAFLRPEKDDTPALNAIFREMRKDENFINTLPAEMKKRVREISRREGMKFAGGEFEFVDTVYQRWRNFTNIPAYIRNLTGVGRENEFRARYGAFANKDLPKSQFVLKTFKEILDTTPEGSAKFQKDYNLKVRGNVVQMQKDNVRNQIAIQKTLEELRSQEKLTSDDRKRERLLMARGKMLNLKTTMTFFYAGLVQGESGGRAISNEDFERIYNALWGGQNVGGMMMAGSMQELKKTINGILRRAEQDTKWIGYGDDMNLADAMVKLDSFAENKGASGLGRRGSPDAARAMTERIRQEREVPISIAGGFKTVGFTKIDHNKPDPAATQFYNRALTGAKQRLVQDPSWKGRLKPWTKLEGTDRVYAMNNMVRGLLKQNVKPGVNPIGKDLALKANVKQILNNYNRKGTKEEDRIGFGDILENYIMKKDYIKNNSLYTIEQQKSDLAWFFQDLFNDTFRLTEQSDQ